MQTDIISLGSPDCPLFKRQSRGLSFKLKSFFRSKESLATELKSVLNDSECCLTAYIIDNLEVKKVPHSAFHSLETTHMRTILCQLYDNKWFETFSKLGRMEHQSLQRIISPWSGGRRKIPEREVLVLKVLHSGRHKV